MRLILTAVMMITLSSCSLLLPIGDQGYPNGRGRGVYRQQTHINDVIRTKGYPAYTDSYMNGRNRIDVLYYYQPSRNNRYDQSTPVMMKYTFRNSYLQSVKKVKMKQRKGNKYYNRHDGYERHDRSDRDYRHNRNDRGRGNNQRY